MECRHHLAFLNVYFWNAHKVWITLVFIVCDETDPDKSVWMEQYKMHIAAHETVPFYYLEQTDFKVDKSNKTLLGTNKSLAFLEGINFTCCLSCQSFTQTAP